MQTQHISTLWNAIRTPAASYQSSQLLNNPHNTNAKRDQPRHQTNHQHATQRFLPITDLRVIGTRRGNADIARIADALELLVVAGPAVVEEGVEGEREVAGGEDDEVEVAEEEQGFGDGGAEAEAVVQLSVMGV